jgi:hypothetical protein
MQRTINVFLAKGKDVRLFNFYPIVPSLIVVGL